MTKDKYAQKIKSLVLTKQLINGQIDAAQRQYIKDFEAGNTNSSAWHTYHALVDERYEVNAKLGKIQDQMKKDGFELRHYCELHNMYLDQFNFLVNNNNI